MENVVLANKGFEYFVVKDKKVIFSTKNIEKLKDFLQTEYNKKIYEFKYDNSILEKTEKK